MKQPPSDPAVLEPSTGGGWLPTRSASVDSTAEASGLPARAGTSPMPGVPPVSRTPEGLAVCSVARQQRDVVHDIGGGEAARVGHGDLA
jgi:hypothetical protein